MESSVNRSYVAVLAIIAITILVVGAWLKPHRSKPEPLSESETATLQARVQRNSLDRSAAFFSQTAQDLAPFVSYRPERKASAVIWAKNQLLSAGMTAGRFSAPIALEQASTGAAPPVRPGVQIAGDWILVVGKTADGLVWFPVVSGGTRNANCAGSAYSEIVVNGNIASAPTGAGVFDLDQKLAGVVLRCDGSLHIASTASVPALLQHFDSAAYRIGVYGVHATPLPAELESLFEPATGLLITEVRDDSAAERASLRAGDLVTGAGDRPVTSLNDLVACFSATPPGETLQVIRQGKAATLRPLNGSQTNEADAMGMQIAPPVSDGPALSITPGSAADRAGLRTGDVLLQIDAQSVRSKQVGERIMAKGSDQPRLVVYRRGNLERATVLKP